MATLTIAAPLLAQTAPPRRGRFNPTTLQRSEVKRAGPEITTTQETNGPYVRPRPKRDTQQAAPTAYRPPPWRLSRYRDGLYLRLSAGFGVAWDAGEANGIDLGTFSSFGVATELALGWNLIPGLALALSVDNIVSTGGSSTLESGSKLETGSTQALVVGPSLDFYPWSRGGLHTQLGLGFASFTASNFESEDLFGRAHIALGFGMVLGTGYEWWVSDQWSMGVLGRLLYTWTSLEDGASWQHRSSGLSIMLTATY